MIEIIDLLSSPDVAPPPRPKTKLPLPARPNPQPPARALDYDMLDLTGSVYNALPGPSRAAPVAPSKNSSKGPAKVLGTRSHDYSFLSDDDYDLGATAHLFDDAPPLAKKPRTSATTVSGTTKTSTQRAASTFIFGPSTGAAAWGAPGVLQSAAPRRWNSAIDPIQTSSDPFADSPRHKTADKENGMIDLSQDDALDPFASSPALPMVEEKENESILPQTIRSEEQLLPSPCSGDSKLQGVASARAARHRFSSSPMFMSSRPQSKMGSPVQKTTAKGKGRTSASWNHISSSAPEASQSDDWNLDMQPARVGLARSRSDRVKKDFDLGDPDTFDFGSDDGSDDDLLDISALKPRKRKAGMDKSHPNKVTKRSATSKSSSSTTLAEKEAEKLEKVQAREAQKLKKQQEKDEAKEKRRVKKERAAALAEVNKVKTDKNVSTPEMIVDLPTSLRPLVKVQAEEFLKDLKVEVKTHHTPVNNVVTWRRKVKARYNAEENIWEPILERIENESHALFIVQAAEFVELALGAKGSDIEAHVLKMQRHYADHTLIYLVEGLAVFLRKNATARNRQFQAAVRASAAAANDEDNASAPPPSTQQRKRKEPRPPTPQFDEGSVEDALVSLQIQHNVLVHHTAAPVATAEWVKIFTQHISTIPYRRQKDAVAASAAFCMDSGQGRTGDSAADTWLRMLQEIKFITAPVAHGITGEFGSMAKLVRGFELQGPLALEGIKKHSNQNGGFTDRNVGQAISKRVYRVFMGGDEHSMDI